MLDVLEDDMGNVNIKEIVNDIESILKKYKLQNKIDLQINNLSINGKDLSLGSNCGIRHAPFTSFSNPIQNYFEKIIKPYHDQYLFHYTTAINAISILKNKQIKVSNLYHIFDKDPLEFFEFLYFTGLSNYNYNIETLKNIFVLCASNSQDQKELWDKFADKGEGVVFGFRNNYNNVDYPSWFQIREVVYNSSRFDFIKEIQSKLWLKYSLQLKIPNSYFISRFFKSNKFRKEKEIRLCFDLNNAKENYIEDEPEQCDPLVSWFIKNCSSGDKFILDFQNQIFSYKPEIVILGKNISKENQEKIIKYCGNKVSKWKYKNS